MATKRSKWENEDEDDVETQRRKREREEKKKAKVQKKLKSDLNRDNGYTSLESSKIDKDNTGIERIVKRGKPAGRNVSTFHRYDLDAPVIFSCRNIDNYETLNHIEEGSYGIVYRARDKTTGDI